MEGRAPSRVMEGRAPSRPLVPGTRPRRSVALHVCRPAVRCPLEGRAPSRPLAVAWRPRRSVALQITSNRRAATTERGPPCLSSGRAMPSGGTRSVACYGGTRSVASPSTRYAATTERGPTDHSRTCAHGARKLRHKRLKQWPVGGTACSSGDLLGRIVPAEKRQHLVEDQGVGCHGLARVDRRPALPVAESSAGFLDDRR